MAHFARFGSHAAHPMPFARLSLVISLTLRFISSCASRSLDCLIIVASFSSWLSISMFTWGGGRVGRVRGGAGARARWAEGGGLAPGYHAARRAPYDRVR